MKKTHSLFWKDVGFMFGSFCSYFFMPIQYLIIQYAPSIQYPQGTISQAAQFS